MSILLPRAQMTVSGTPGSGTITLGAANGNFQTFANAGAANGDLVDYLIEDGTAWEIGRGVYTSSGTTLSRASTTDPLAGFASSSGARLTLSSSAIVSLIEVPGSIDGGFWRVKNLAAGNYVFSPLQLPNNTTTASFNTGFIHCVPFLGECVVDGIAIEVTTAVAGNMRLGLYNCDKNGAPSTLIEEVASPPSTGTTGIKVGLLAAARRIVEPVWICATPSVNVTGVRATSAAAQASGQIMGGSALTGTVAYQEIFGTFTYGALPTNFNGGSITSITQNAGASALIIQALRTA